MAQLCQLNVSCLLCTIKTVSLDLTWLVFLGIFQNILRIIF